MGRTTKIYNIYIFGILSKNCFFSAMKKRTLVQQIGGRTRVVYTRKSQGYGRKRHVFRLFGSDRITVAHILT